MRYIHKFTLLALLLIIQLPAMVIAQDEILKNYRYDSQNDDISFQVSQTQLHQIMNILAVKQDIKIHVTHVPDREITGTFTGKTDKVIKELLQTDNLVLIYKKNGISSRLSSVEALSQGHEDSAFLSNGAQANTLFDNSEHMKKKEAQRQKREYRHSMGLGRINEHAGEPEFLEKKREATE